jgi:hypothetical protein
MFGGFGEPVADANALLLSVASVHKVIFCGKDAVGVVGLGWPKTKSTNRWL